MRPNRRNVRLPFLRRLLVIGALSFVISIGAEANPNCVEKQRIIDAAMPNLSDDQRTIVAEALHLRSDEPHPICNFELDATLDYIPSRIERFDPNMEENSPWTLISIEDREPRDRERKQTPRYTRLSPTEIWNDLRENINWTSLEVVNDSAEQLSLAGLKDVKVGKDEFVPSDVKLEIDKATRSLQSVTITMNKPHKINFFATIAAMTMTQSYRYDSDISRSIVNELLVDWKFKFFFAPSSSTERITYRDYDCQSSSKMELCVD